MLLPLVFNVAPRAFVDAIDLRLANTKMHVVEWWAADLDGDKVPEAIAAVCDDDSGLFLVQHGKDLLEAPMGIDGRNSCPAADRPAWKLRTEPAITHRMSVHHGSVATSIALRGGKL